MTIQIQITSQTNGIAQTLMLNDAGKKRHTMRAGDRVAFVQNGIDVTPPNLKISRMGSSVVLEWQNGDSQLILDNLATTPDALVHLPGADASQLGEGFSWSGQSAYLGGTDTDSGYLWPVIAGLASLIALGRSQGGADDNAIYGTPGNDIPLLGTQRSDRIFALSGQDLVEAGNGNDVVDGGDGDDTLLGEQGNDTLNGGDGNDQLIGGEGNDTLSGGNGDDTLMGGAGSNSLNGGAGFDYADYTGTNVSMTYLLDPAQNSFLPHGMAGEIDTLIGIEALILGNGNNYVFGGDASNTVIGGTGADTIHGYDGNDSLAGGGGNDLIFGERGRDTLAGNAGNDTLDGGSNDAGQYDVATYAAATASVTVVMANTGANGSAVGDASVGTDVLIEIEGIVGSDFADSIIGASQFNESNGVNGGAGNDIIRLYGSATSGGSYIRGDAGNDLIDGSNAANYLNLFGDNDQDPSYGGNDTILGGSNNDAIYGGLGNNVLAGGGGNDTFTASMGGSIYSGGDSLFADSGSADRVTFADTVYNTQTSTAVVINNDTIAQTYNLVTYAANSGTGGAAAGSQFYGIEQYVFAGGANLGDAGDVFLGGASNESIVGTGNGADYYFGGAGNDTLNSGAGNDTLNGGFGNDVILAGAGDDYVYAGQGSDSLSGGAGNDTLDFSLSGLASITISLANFALASSNGDTVVANTFEAFIGTGGADSVVSGTGNDTLDGGMGNDTIDGGNGNDLIYGGIGNDVLLGGNGNDTLYGGAGSNTLNGGAASDVVDYSNLAGNLTISLGATGNGSVTHSTGSDTLISIEQVIGTATGANSLVGNNQNEALTGGAAADTLRGFGGNDTLNGGAGGADILDGGLGMDVADYSWMSSAATITLNAAATVTFFDGANSDSLIAIEGFFAGSGNDSVTQSSALGTVLRGNAGNDTLIGNTGNDVLDGGADNDSLVGGDGNDTLTGGNGNDTLFGGNGDDALNIGGLGSDSVDGGANVDLISFSALTTGISHTLLGGTETVIGAGLNVEASNIEQWRFTAGNDTISGSAAADWLAGDLGSDSLQGNDGGDTLLGDAGHDIISGGTGSNSLLGGTGFDSLDYRASTANLTVTLSGAGLGTTTASDASLNDTLSGFEFYQMGGGNDSIVANVGYAPGQAVIFSGGAGNDTIIDNSSTIYNALYGGSGNNSLVGNASGVAYFYTEEAGSDTVIGNATSDYWYLTGSRSVIYESVNGYQILNNSAASASTTWTFNYTAQGTGTVLNAATGVTDHFSGIETIDFGATSDTIYASGSFSANTILLDNGNDAFFGGGGNDLVHGEAGSDTLYSSGGNDTLRLNNGGSVDANTSGNLDALVYSNQTAGIVWNVAEGASGQFSQTYGTAAYNPDTVVKLAGGIDEISSFNIVVATNYNDRIVLSDASNLFAFGFEHIVAGSGHDTFQIDTSSAKSIDFTNLFYVNSHVGTTVQPGVFGIDAIDMTGANASTVTLSYQDFMQRDASQPFDGNWFTIMGNADDVLRLDLRGGAFQQAGSGVSVAVDLNGDGDTADAGEFGVTAAGGAVVIGGVAYHAYTTPFAQVYENVLIQDALLSNVSTVITL